MATYNMLFYTESQITSTPPTDINGNANFGELFENSDDGNQDADGNNGTLNPGTFTISGTPSLLSVNDDDTEFTDDSTMLFDPQLLAQGIDSDGDGIEDYAAGSNVEILYSYTVSGSDGSVITVYAVGAGANYLNDDFIGILSSQPLKPGVTYTVTDYDPLVDIQYSNVAPFCFGRGTLITTEHGKMPVENLQQGDLVMTRDHGLQPIRWTGHRSFTAAELAGHPNFCPIRIRAGALAPGRPERDLIVSPQHRVLVKSRIAHRMFGTDEVLIAAKHLLAVRGIEEASDLDGVDYFHILFDDHEVVLSNGAETESLHPGPQALKSVGAAGVAEILALFPELADYGATRDIARVAPIGRKSRRLAERHTRNKMPLVN